MTSNDRLIKRLALQIADQLPNNLGKAIEQFERAVELIEEAYAARTVKSRARSTSVR